MPKTDENTSEMEAWLLYESESPGFFTLEELSQEEPELFETINSAISRTNSESIV